MILVTGATGLTGSHIALQLLERGGTVRATYRNHKNISKTKSLFSLYGKQHLFENIEWVSGDVCDIPALEAAFIGIEHVYHCAALISFDPNDEEKLRKTNIEGTANVVNLCLKHGISKLCHISSAAALGDLKEQEKFNATITEETEWNPEKPHSDYAISKFGAEMEIWRGQQEGLNVIIVNPGIIIGPPLWQTGSSQLFHLISKGQRFYTNGTMAFVAVTDVAKAVVQLMESDISGERFILSSETLTYREVFVMAAKVMKKERPSVEAKPWMTALGWKLDWVVSKLTGAKRKISKDDARTLHTTESYSNEKIVRFLNYTFKGINDTMSEIALLMKW